MDIPGEDIYLSNVTLFVTYFDDYFYGNLTNIWLYYDFN